MPLRLFNTLTRTLDPFEPLAPPAVTMYVCGPTVYDVPHIGHLRSAYTFEILRRTLAAKDFEVMFVRNVTDVDDKIIERARQEPGPGDLAAKCRAVAERYLKSYHDALDRLGIERPTREPKATEHVVPDPKNVQVTNKIDASMTGFISQLITKNAAYPSGGDVYFSVRRFAEYGKLSNRSIDELKSGARVEPGDQKEDPLDFALWKAAKPDEPSWNSPWGPGRPGWHIECSVMSTAYLGDAFDIHGGGVDLVFPHHENELAQARALDKPFAKYWVHNGLLTVDGEKMSKSLGNFVTVEQALAACQGDARILQVLFLGTHYRSPLNYSEDTLQAAAGRWNRWNCYLLPTEGHRLSVGDVPEFPEVAKLRDKFLDALDEDLNTPAALAVIDELITWGYALQQQLETSPNLTMESRLELWQKSVAVVDVFQEFGGTLGLVWTPMPALTPEEVELLNRREDARTKKDFRTADQLREELAKRGVVVEDTPLGQRAMKR